MQKSTLSKIILLAVALLIGAIIGNLLMVGILMAFGVALSESNDVFALLNQKDLELPIKLGIALSHLFLFTFSSLLYWKWAYQENAGAYFAWNRKYDFSKQVVFISILICAYPLIAASADVFRFFNLPEWMQANDESQLEALSTMLAMDHPLDFLINLIVVALLPAIGEELLFRGIIQQELMKLMKSKHLAILIASFIFAAVHLQIIGLPPKLIIGLILGYTLYWTKHIKYAMVLHFINNSLPLIALYAAREVPNSSSELSGEASASIYFAALFSIILVYFLVLYVSKNISVDESKT
jgi:membrane protease YdiL (CAAX protease family)